MTAFMRTRPNEGGLSGKEKDTLTDRLLEHVSSLEAFLPKLKPSKVSVPDYESAGTEGGGQTARMDSLSLVSCCSGR